MERIFFLTFLLNQKESQSISAFTRLFTAVKVPCHTRKRRSSFHLCILVKLVVLETWYQQHESCATHPIASFILDSPAHRPLKRSTQFKISISTSTKAEHNV